MVLGTQPVLNKRQGMDEGVHEGTFFLPSFYPTLSACTVPGLTHA